MEGLIHHRLTEEVLPHNRAHHLSAFIFDQILVPFQHIVSVMPPSQVLSCDDLVHLSSPFPFHLLDGIVTNVYGCRLCGRGLAGSVCWCIDSALTDFGIEVYAKDALSGWTTRIPYYTES